MASSLRVMQSALRPSALQGIARPSVPARAATTRSMGTGAAGASDVAVIGAGLAGLVCARTLADKGLKVSVFEQARGVGGRMSTRRIPMSEAGSEEGPDLRFDHGAQFLSPKTPAFKAMCEEWVASGAAALWEGKFGSVDVAAGTVDTDSSGKQRFVGVPSMNSICVHIASGLDVSTGAQATGLEWGGPQAGWSVSLGPDGEGAGSFRGLVVADKLLASPRFAKMAGLPAPPLQGAAPALAAELAAVDSAPSFAAMVAFARPLGDVVGGLDGVEVAGQSALAWAAKDSSKPGRGRGDGIECWVLHSTAEYAAARVAELPPGRPSPEFLARVASDLIEGLATVAGVAATGPDAQLPPVLLARAHRWGSAFPTSATGPVGDDAMRVVACGDFGVAPKCEGAATSGAEAAERLGDLLARSSL